MKPTSRSSTPRGSSAASSSAPGGGGMKASGDDGIRPRNRRLISTSGTEQELVSTSGTSVDGGSRGVSPIPQRYPSRVVSGEGGRIKPVGGLLAPPSDVNGAGNEAGKGGRGSPVGILGGWGIGSWSSWQGLANSVLGGTEEMVSGGKGKGKSWGPESLPRVNDGGIGAGSVAEREATVRRRKMRRVLEGRDEPASAVDTNGNYKHRTSMDEARPGSSQDDEGDAMVYIHHVQPSDTLAGVVLRYNCQPAVFRKANRFWPNDSIQIRKTVVLPIDACAIKGRPCDAPSLDYKGVDLLAPTPGTEEPPSLSNGTGTWPSGKLSSSPSQTSAERSQADDGENPWVHVRWVLLDSSPHSKPVEIARMPRKTLGYFPPRRRKSQSLTVSSVTSTPRASGEFPILDRIPSGTTPVRRPGGLGIQPSVTSIPGSYFPPPAMTTTNAKASRPRRESVNGYAWMSGPGGVGTLGKNVRTPGPGKDSMNSWVKKHLPGIAIDGLPSTSIQGGETAHFGFTDEVMPSISEGGGTPGVSTPLLGPNGLGLENAAAAVEGWIRRLGTPGTPKAGGRAREEVDLIVLLDGGGSDDGRWELSPAKKVNSSITAASGSGSGRGDLEGVARGRKSGKSD